MNNLYRTMFFVPGNDPGKIVKAEIYRADCIIYDLEDSVAIAEKDSARILVRRALESIRPDCRVGVRINAADTEFYHADVAAIVPLRPDFLRLPKTECAQDVINLDNLLSKLETEHNIEPGSIKIVTTIESALGIVNAYQIASASSRVLGIGMGAEDLCTDMHMERTSHGQELALARRMIVLAAHAAKVKALDVVYSDIKNLEGFRENVLEGKMLGYTGKSVVHPQQIDIVHACYEPTDKQIEHALAALEAYEQALINRSGVISLNGKMIDMPMVTRAKDTIEYAQASGKQV